MPDLEPQISAWRRDLSTKGLPPEVLDELEVHLRDETSVLIRSGMDAEPAFLLAQSRLGNPESLRREFSKSNYAHTTPTVIILALWLAGLAAMTAIFWVRSAEKPGWVLLLHFVTLTGGYIAAGIAGSLGIFHVCLRLLNQLTPPRRETVMFGLKSFNRLGAVCVMVGLVFGQLWTSFYRHDFAHPELVGFQIALQLREFCADAVCLLLLAAVAVQHWRFLSDRALVQLSIVGNILIGLAWFGPFIVWVGSRPQFAFNMYSRVLLVLLLHFIFLILSFVCRAPTTTHHAIRNT